MNMNLDDTIGGRVWPGREWMTVQEMLRAIETVMGVERRLHVHCYMYGGREDGTQSWSVTGKVSVEGYISAEEFIALRDALAEHGMYPFISNASDDEGEVHIGLGSKTWNGITTRWESSETDSAARSAGSGNVGSTTYSSVTVHSSSE